MQQSYTVPPSDNGGKFLAYSKERHAVPQSRIAHVITKRAEMADLITLQLPEKNSSTKGERRLLIFLAEAGLNGVDKEVFFQKCDEYLGDNVCDFIKLTSLGYIKSDGNRFFICKREPAEYKILDFLWTVREDGITRQKFFIKCCENSLSPLLLSRLIKEGFIQFKENGRVYLEIPPTFSKLL